MNHCLNNVKAILLGHLAVLLRRLTGPCSIETPLRSPQLAAPSLNKHKNDPTSTLMVKASGCRQVLLEGGKGGIGFALLLIKGSQIFVPKLTEYWRKAGLRCECEIE